MAIIGPFLASSVRPADFVRPFCAEDVPQVIDLHRRIFRTNAENNLDDGYQAYFRSTFMDGPERDGACPSFVSIRPDGKVDGFLGVGHRTIRFGGRSLHVAVSSQFMVDDRYATALPAVRLLKAFLAGPQDVSLADEASDRARLMWEAAGGATALLFSLFWFRVLRPATFVISRSQRRRTVVKTAARAAAPFAMAVDALAARSLPGTSLGAEPALTSETLTGQTLQDGIREAASGRALRPAYTPEALDGLLNRLSTWSGGTFHGLGLRDAHHNLTGWYLYHANKRGLGEVVQVGAMKDFLPSTLDHLFHRAWDQQLTAVCGRVDPPSMDVFAKRGCFFHHRGEWVLISSKIPGVVNAVLRGDAFLTRLEGEWCQRYQAGPV